MLEEIGRHFEELGMWVFRTLTYGGYAVMTHGTPEQKATLLPKVARGEAVFLLRTDGAGFGIGCGCALDSGNGRGWRLRNQWPESIHIRNGYQRLLLIGDANLVYRRKSRKASRISWWIQNYRGSKCEKFATLGQRAIGTTQVFYSGVKVPASAVLGEVDSGWEAVDFLSLV